MDSQWCILHRRHKILIIFSKVLVCSLLLELLVEIIWGLLGVAQRLLGT